MIRYQFRPYVTSICSIVVVICLLAAPSLAVDMVVRRSDNVTLRGELTRSTPSEVVIKRTNGEEVTVSVANLKSVQFDGEPLELRSARSNERSGELETALTKLTDIQKGYSGSDKRLKTDLEFLIARVIGKQALVDSSKAAAAKDALEKFRTTNKTNFRYLEATLLQASIHSVLGEADAGKTLLTEVQQSSVPGFQLQAGVDLGRLLLSSGDAAGAQTAFDDVIGKSQNDESAAGALYDSMLGKALCQKQQNNLDAAITTLDDVISKAPPTETRTLAEAWVRKGDCLRQQNQQKAALMSYLHVDVLYPGEPAQHAEALLRLSELWGPSGHEDRSVEASARLAERYPNSEWAKKIGSGS